MTPREPAETRLLVVAIVAVCLTALYGLYLAMTGMLVDLGPLFTRYLIGAGMCLVSMVLAAFAVEIGFRGLPRGHPANRRAWRLLIGGAVVFVVALVWTSLPMFMVDPLIE